MTRIALAWMGILALGCGPSYGGQDVKSPEEIIEEQERLAEEQDRKSKEHQSSYDVPEHETDEERRTKWDKKQVELELKRAARSAESCPASVTEEAPKGTTTVTLRFGNDGHVKESSIGPPYEETAVGKCVLRAMGAVIVPAYEGSEETVTWDIDLTKGKEDAKTDAKPKGK